MFKTFFAAVLLAFVANVAWSADHEAQVAKMKEAIAALKTPALTAYKISSDDKGFDFDKDGEKQLYGWEIKLAKKIEDKALFTSVSDVLTGKKTYGDSGAKCFEPGFAFRYKDGATMYTFVICLECDWVYATDGKERYQWGISAEGKAALTKLYHDVFGEGGAKK